MGDARYAGFEAAFELDLLSLANGGAESPYGALVLYNNVTLLDAKFTAGPNDGRMPAYAPDYRRSKPACSIGGRISSRPVSSGLWSMILSLPPTMRLSVSSQAG